MAYINKVRFSRGLKNTAGFFMLLFTLSAFIDSGFQIHYLYSGGMLDGAGVLLPFLMKPCSLLIFTIALFTARTPKWLWFPVLCCASPYFFMIYLNVVNNHEYSEFGFSPIFTLCCFAGYCILFFSLFIKRFAKNIWLVSAILIILQDVFNIILKHNELPVYIEYLRLGHTRDAAILINNYCSYILCGAALFFVCAYVGGYSASYLRAKSRREASTAAASSDNDEAETGGESYKRLGSEVAARRQRAERSESSDSEDELAAEIERLSKDK